MKLPNKLFIILTALFSVWAGIHADECEEYGCLSDFDGCGCPDWRIALRTAYFYPSSHLERDIYDGARFDVELEVARTIFENIDLWANLTYFSKQGRSLGLHERTTLELVPLTLGVKYVWPISCRLSLYAGLGVNYTWLHLHNETELTPRHVNKSKAGATWASGLYYQINQKLYADLFVDYLYLPMHLGNVDNIGGVRAGIGLGMRI